VKEIQFPAVHVMNCLKTMFARDLFYNLFD